MSEFTPAPEGQNGSQNGAEPAQPPLLVNHQYVKDLSFEVPGAPDIFATLRSAPQVQINLDVQARRLQEGQEVFEVTLAVRAEASDTSSGTARVVFIAELSYGGIFTLTSIPEASVEPVLLVECPRLLFPFARNIIADVTREGGFPPVLLQPIDFVSLWQSRRGVNPAIGHA